MVFFAKCGINPSKNARHHVTLLYLHRELVSFGFNTEDEHSEAVCFKSFLQHVKIFQLSPQSFKGQCIAINLRFSNTLQINMSKPCIHCARFVEKYKFLLSHFHYSNGMQSFSSIPIEQWSNEEYYCNSKKRFIKHA